MSLRIEFLKYALSELEVKKSLILLGHIPSENKCDKFHKLIHERDSIIAEIRRGFLQSVLIDVKDAK